MEEKIINREKMASFIDHTLLRPHATKNQIINLCKEAMNFGFWSVCVNPSYVSLASKILKNSKVKICSVIGFPLGASTAEVKAFEAVKAINDGANEIDMVINLGALKSGDYELVKRDILAVVKKAKDTQKKVIVKVIIETGLLSEDEKVLACNLVKESGADFVKTSTGINSTGATVQDVKLLRKTVGPMFGVKASGGIRTYVDAINLIKAGATRLGTSSGLAIIKEIKS
jgi:deoxyribose-phosphate aldolase